MKTIVYVCCKCFCCWGEGTDKSTETFCKTNQLKLFSKGKHITKWRSVSSLLLQRYLYLTMNRSKFNNRAKGVNCNKPFKRSASGSSGNYREDPNDVPLRPPPKLKGKALGLWYRDRNRQKELKSVSISLEREKVEKIENILWKTSSLKAESDDNAEGSFRQIFLRDRHITFEEKLNSIGWDVVAQIPNLDEELYKELQEKKNNADYKKMFKFRQILPAYKKRQEIVDAIDKNQIVIVSGETGSGKTTQIVQFVLDSYITQKKGSLCEIICTQPRRISAITVAERVAAERSERLGVSVGYVIRLQSEPPLRSKGTITFLTTGILIQRLQSDPSLKGVSHLFVDEIHERDTSSDFLLALLKFILPKRPDLKIVLMSATLNPEKFSDYFGGVPLLHIPGNTYPVEELYLEHILQRVPFRFQKSNQQPWSKRKGLLDPTFQNYVIPYVNNLERCNTISKSVAMELRNPESETLSVDLVSAVIFHICNNEDEGAILVFLPGLAQIQDVMKCLNGHRYFSPSRALIIPMHSIMPTVSQKEAFSTPPNGIRKIILSTSICETSITIDDVRYVVDCGKSKMKGFDLTKNVETLEPEWETEANAKQRKGRAGRTRAGKCYKLYTKAREEMFELFPLPDIQRCRLEEVILKAKTLQLGRIGPFLEKLMDPPDPKGVELSLKMLTTLNLLDNDERLTPLGYHVSKLPLDPQTGKMILMGAIFSCVDPVLSIAACLNFKDPFHFVFGKEAIIRQKREKFANREKSDHFMLANAVIQWEEANDKGYGSQFAYSNFLSYHNLNLLSKMKKQFASYLNDMKFVASMDPKDPASNINSHNASLIKAIVCSGLYPNVAMIKRIIKSKVTGETKAVFWKTVDHPRVQLHLKSVLESEKKFESSFIVYFEKIKSSAIFLHDATMVYPMALLFFGENCDIIENDGYFIAVDSMIKFSCTKRTAVLVHKLRQKLLSILEEAVSNPRVFNWNTNNQNTLVLKSIIELITSEDKTTMDEFDVEMQ